MIGGGGEKKTLRFVAKYADACNLFPEPDLARKLDVLRAHCDAEGRDYDDITKTCYFIFDEGDGGVDDALPAEVGLRAVQQQEAGALEVGQLGQDQLGQVDARVVVRQERHARAPRAVVVERVDVEAGDDTLRQGRGQLLDGELPGAAGVEETGQVVDQDGLPEVGVIGLEAVQVLCRAHVLTNVRRWGAIPPGSVARQTRPHD